MPDTKIEDLGTTPTLLVTDLLAVVSDPGGTPLTVRAPISQVLALAGGGGGGGGGPALLEQHTASGSPSLAFTTGVTSAYDDYLVELVDLIFVNNTVDLYFEVSPDGGATWLTTGVYYQGSNGIALGGFSFASANDNPGTAFKIAIQVDNTGRGLWGSLHLGGMLSTALASHIVGHIAYSKATVAGIATVTCLVYDTPILAHNAFRFRCSSGNIASGTIRLYGFEK